MKTALATTAAVALVALLAALPEPKPLSFDNDSAQVLRDLGAGWDATMTEIGRFAMHPIKDILEHREEALKQPQEPSPGAGVSGWQRILRGIRGYQHGGIVTSPTLLGR